MLVIMKNSIVDDDREEWICTGVVTVHMAVVNHRSEWNQVVISTMQGFYPDVVTAQDDLHC
jgi:hypothetical protein